jgi:probable H4MPT-linked C1 transfer pathway protein
MPDIATGWDIGGAHLKVAQAAADGRLIAAAQVPCTLWRGLDHLVVAIEAVRPELAPASRHGIAMTGELVDLFADRKEGVAQLAEVMAQCFPGEVLRIYAGADGFRPLAEAPARWLAVASANWHAGAAFAASRRGDGLFLDIGSTTADLVPFARGRVANMAYSDAERLASDEMVYTGVTRTPVMAVASEAPFAGQRQRLMAEHFATMADVHRLTGELPGDADQHDTADGRGKTEADSARRLARMLGRDADLGDLRPWRRLARHLSERQCQMLQSAVDRVLSRGILPDAAPIVGAGVGRFLALRIALRVKRPYVDFAALLSGEARAVEWAARCAPAAALAVLAAGP